MKSGISISKINEMINEGLASAGGDKWKLAGSANGIGTWISFPDNFNELKIISKIENCCCTKIITKFELDNYFNDSLIKYSNCINSVSFVDWKVSRSTKKICVNGAYWGNIDYNDVHSKLLYRQGAYNETR